MIDLNIEFNRANFESVMSRVELLASKAEIDKAINRAAKRAADSAKTETVRLIGGEYTLPASELRGTISTRNLGNGEIGAVMNISSSPFPMSKFSGVTPNEVMPPAKGPVRAQVKKSGSGAELGKAFVAKMKSGHVGVFEREDEKRGDYDTQGNKTIPDRIKRNGKWVANTEKIHIEEKFSPSTPGMFKANEKVNEPVREKAMGTFEKRVIHELERLMYG